MTHERTLDDPVGDVLAWRLANERREVLARVESRKRELRRTSTPELAEAVVARALAISSPAARRPRKRHRYKVPPALRQRVYERDGWACLTCGTGDRLTVDHYVPRAHGGLTIASNLRTLCAPCNQAKGDQIPTEWRRI